MLLPPGCPSKVVPLQKKKNASKLHRARSHVTHKKILVEANALYDTKFAKTIVKIVFVNFFSRSFCKALIQRKKIPTEIEKKIERILIKK